MAEYRVKRVVGVGPGESLGNWVASFDDEYYAREDAQRRAKTEADPAVCEYVVYQTFPKKSPIRKATYLRGGEQIGG